MLTILKYCCPWKIYKIKFENKDEIKENKNEIKENSLIALSMLELVKFSVDKDINVINEKITILEKLGLINIHGKTIQRLIKVDPINTLDSISRLISNNKELNFKFLHNISNVKHLLTKDHFKELQIKEYCGDIKLELIMVNIKKIDHKYNMDIIYYNYIDIFNSNKLIQHFKIINETIDFIIHNGDKEEVEKNLRKVIYYDL